MKASIKFREEQMPLMRAKIPINILNFPFQSGVVAGESEELSLNLTTYFESGPSLKFAYRPNNPESPFGFVLKAGVGRRGSPIRSPLTVSAEFNVIGCEEPSFFIRFKPDLGDFSLTKLISSAIVRKLGWQSKSAANNDGSFFSSFAGLLPTTAESKAAAGLMVNGIVRGTNLTATTVLPLRDCAVLNFRWGLRVPPRDTADEYNAVVARRRPRPRTDRTSGYRFPQLVMDKVRIEHVAKAYSSPEKVDSGEEFDNVAAEPESHITAGNLEILPENTPESTHQ